MDLLWPATPPHGTHRRVSLKESRGQPQQQGTDPARVQGSNPTKVPTILQINFNLSSMSLQMTQLFRPDQNQLVLDRSDMSPEKIC